MPQVVVSSNCQTNGMVAALRVLLPGWEVRALPLPWPFTREEHFAQVARELAQADWWLTIAMAPAAQRVVALADNPGLQLQLIPEIGFKAFHPDLCYVRAVDSNELTTRHYNSAIAAWAWNHHLSLAATQRLFNRRSYRELGYFDQWQGGVDHLQALFRLCKLSEDFDRFFLHVQRRGNFMHSINHPKIHALTRLSQLVALRLGQGPAVLQQHVELDDELADTIWPLYPEVADCYSIDGGSYNWKFADTGILGGITAYLEFCFASYEAQGLQPGQLRILNRDVALLDQVLGSQLGVSA